MGPQCVDRGHAQRAALVTATRCGPSSLCSLQPQAPGQVAGPRPAGSPSQRLPRSHGPGLRGQGLCFPFAPPARPSFSYSAADPHVSFSFPGSRERGREAQPGGSSQTGLFLGSFWRDGRAWPQLQALTIPAPWPRGNFTSSQPTSGARGSPLWLP